MLDPNITPLLDLAGTLGTFAEMVIIGAILLVVGELVIVLGAVAGHDPVQGRERSVGVREEG